MQKIRNQNITAACFHRLPFARCPSRFPTPEPVRPAAEGGRPGPCARRLHWATSCTPPGQTAGPPGSWPAGSAACTVSLPVGTPGAGRGSRRQLPRPDLQPRRPASRPHSPHPLRRWRPEPCPRPPATESAPAVRSAIGSGGPLSLRGRATWVWSSRRGGSSARLLRVGAVQPFAHLHQT